MAQDDVLRILKDYPKGLSSKELTEKIGTTRCAVDNSVRKLLKAKSVKFVNRAINERWSKFEKVYMINGDKKWQ